MILSAGIPHGMPALVGDNMSVYNIGSIFADLPYKAVLPAYIAVMSIVTFCFYGHDKKAARHRQQRVPEKRLFLLNFAGGFMGGWFGMYFFHHKTKHKSFYFVQFLSALVWSCLLIFVFVYL